MTDSRSLLSQVNHREKATMHAFMILYPYAAGGSFGQYKMMQKNCKITETMEHGY